MVVLLLHLIATWRSWHWYSFDYRVSFVSALGCQKSCSIRGMDGFLCYFGLYFIQYPIFAYYWISWGPLLVQWNRQPTTGLAKLFLSQPYWQRCCLPEICSWVSIGISLKNPTRNKKQNTNPSPFPHPPPEKKQTKNPRTWIWRRIFETASWNVSGNSSQRTKNVEEGPKLF